MKYITIYKKTWFIKYIHKKYNYNINKIYECTVCDYTVFTVQTTICPVFSLRPLVPYLPVPSILQSRLLELGQVGLYQCNHLSSRLRVCYRSSDLVYRSGAAHVPRVVRWALGGSASLWLFHCSPDFLHTFSISASISFSRCSISTSDTSISDSGV